MNNNEMKNRWIALYVENEVGVLAKVSGLFSAKSYNLQSLTVGTTEDETISRMTICVTSDDITFEQIKKQLNRMVEVIKVIDLTDVPLHMKEILYVRVSKLTREEITDIFQTAQVFNIDVVDKNARQRDQHEHFFHPHSGGFFRRSDLIGAARAAAGERFAQRACRHG